MNTVMTIHTITDGDVEQEEVYFSNQNKLLKQFFEGNEDCEAIQF